MVDQIYIVKSKYQIYQVEMMCWKKYTYRSTLDMLKLRLVAVYMQLQQI